MRERIKRKARKMMFNENGVAYGTIFVSVTNKNNFLIKVSSKSFKT